MILDKKRAIITLLLAASCAACGRAPAGLPNAAASGMLVVATTSTLGSLVSSVGADKISVRSLVPIGVSPETYEPTPQDIMGLEHAALVIENGSGLESWLDKIIKTSARNARVLVLSNGIPGVQPSRTAAGGGLTQSRNPHFWMDPNYAQLYVVEIARALSNVDPANAAQYKANAAAEIKRLSALDNWTRRRIATVPPDRRTMIAFHDAWYYFDTRYGIRDIGVIESSPGREPSAADLARLIALAKANRVRAVFAEPEFSPKLAKQLADDAGIMTVTNLYDDSLGTTPQLSTYEGMMRHNVDTIVWALGS